MTLRSLSQRLTLFAAISLPVFASLAACRSHHIETSVENRTGSGIQLLEVDYPNASFGSNILAAGAIFHYRIQLQGSGPLKVQFTGADGKLEQVTGPSVSEGQEGSLDIILLPAGHAEFHPELTAKP